MKLIRFWFKFKNDGKLPPGVVMGCGVTAFNFEDAKGLLSVKVFKSIPFIITKHEENIDISMLDSNHVLPNMLSPITRGVWFPMGYE